MRSVRFDSLAELETWCDEQCGYNELYVPRESIEDYTRSRKKETGLQLIFCHDYRGNYQPEEDENPQGYFPHKTGTHYYVQFPQLADYFVYFSHHQVSIPPVSWINSLHRQGIPVLGTLIFEGTNYRQLDKLLEKNSKGEFKFVRILTDLCKLFKFDGWLLNIETHFTTPSKGFQLVNFMELLKGELHLHLPNAKLIWYDSFLIGKNRVAYQNCVNSWNYQQFLAADYFFTNYWWDKAMLQTNIVTCGIQGTKEKIFSGIDVFGRGSQLHNGGFSAPGAMRYLAEMGSNVCLFAPSWVYENLDKSNFISNDCRFWTGIDTHKNSVAEYVAPYTTSVRSYQNNIQFYTNFSTGEGAKFYSQGEAVYAKPWVNGSLQTSLPFGISKRGLYINRKDAFVGGGSLSVTAKENNKVSLFKFKNEIKSPKLELKVSFKYPAAMHAKSELFYRLEVRYYLEKRYKTVARIGEGVLKQELKCNNHSTEWEVVDVELELPVMRIREHLVLDSVDIVLLDGAQQVRDSDDDDWVILPNDNVEREILIGDLYLNSIIAVEPDVKPVDTITSTAAGGGLLLKWSDDKRILFWIVYADGEFIGVSHTNCYLAVTAGRFRVDIVTRKGELIQGCD